jgi:CshA-type fibril repeat protein
MNARRAPAGISPAIVDKTAYSPRVLSLRPLPLALVLAGSLLGAGPTGAGPAGAVPALRGGPVADWGPLTSTGAGLRKQTVHVPVPAGWRLTLDRRAPQYVDTVLVPEGFYTQDSPATVTFTPNPGYLGTASPVTIRLAGPGGQVRTRTYRATVTLPPPPAAPDLTSSGRARTPQQVGFPLPVGGSHGYADGSPPKVPQGEFSAAAISGVSAVPGRPMDPTLIEAEGFLIFTPRRGFSGPVPAVRYRITDAYGQTSVGRWTPHVTGY